MDHPAGTSLANSRVFPTIEEAIEAAEVPYQYIVVHKSKSESGHDCAITVDRPVVIIGAGKSVICVGYQ